MGYRDKFLQEMLRLDGLRGDDASFCRRCGKDQTAANAALYRCKDCLGGELSCAECCVLAHAENPFHRVSVSTTVFVFYIDTQYFVHDGNGTAGTSTK